MDSEVQAFGVRVSGKPDGATVKSFILFRRFPGSNNPTRRVLGSYLPPGAHGGDLTLAQARELAGQWNRLIKQGIDPKAEAARQRDAELEAKRTKEANTFGHAFEVYLKRKVSRLRSGRIIEREMRREFSTWMTRPLADINQTDVKNAIRAIIDRGAEGQSHVIFAMLRGFLNWCVDSGDFAIASSPCDRVKASILIGKRNIRDRVLRDAEIASFWRGTGNLGYPYGPLFRLLILTALRRNEVANVQWGEFDMGKKLWTIGASRMKGGAAHVVPLTDDIIHLLSALPRFSGGDYVFSSTGGRQPVSGFSRAKARLDKLMCSDLKASLEPFVLHDLRRTVRTRLSSLPISGEVKELLLAHVQPGLHQVYDLHTFEDEKRQALSLWHIKLRQILEPKNGNNVLPFSLAS